MLKRQQLLVHSKSIIPAWIYSYQIYCCVWLISHLFLSPCDSLALFSTTHLAVRTWGFSADQGLSHSLPTHHSCSRIAFLFWARCYFGASWAGCLGRPLVVTTAWKMQLVRSVTGFCGSIAAIASRATRCCERPDQTHCNFLHACAINKKQLVKTNIVKEL